MEGKKSVLQLKIYHMKKYFRMGISILKIDIVYVTGSREGLEWSVLCSEIAFCASIEMKFQS